jgi:hypothetical protein
LKPEVEVQVHSGMLTALDIHPTKDIVATVSEDSTDNVIPIPSKSNLQVWGFNSALLSAQFVQLKGRPL